MRGSASDLWLRLRALLFPRRVEQELDEELQSHIELQARKLAAAGLSEAEARRQAIVQFGGVAQVSEACREARGIHWLTTSLQDIRYALRGFRRAPLFAATVVATIALGLGIDTALFTVFDAYYFRPVNVTDPQSLYAAAWRDAGGAAHDFTWPEYQALLDGNPAFSDAFASHGVESRFNGRQLMGLMVTAGYFRILGGEAERGRTLLADDGAAVVLSHAAWRNRFGGDPEILGKQVLLGGSMYQVVGVARAGFRGLGARPVDFWVPLAQSSRFGAEQTNALSVVGRLRPGYRESQARAGLTVWATRQIAGARQVVLTSAARFKPWRATNTFAFAPLVAAFSLVLLIGCANVANMMLARAVARQRELAIRLSLGASRGRLVRQLLTESLLLALPAAVAGFAVARAVIGLCLQVLLATIPAGIADFVNRFPTLEPDGRVFAYNLALALAAALLFGLAPALHAARGTAVAGSRPARSRNALVAGQILVCVLLLVTAGVLLRGIARMRGLDGALSARDTIEIAVQDRFRARAVQHLVSDPEVETLAAAAHAPVDRKPMRTVGGNAAMAVNRVSPEYFGLFEIAIRRGRNFTAEETRSSAAVAVVSEAAARRLWPGRDAIGQSLRVESEPAPVQIVGVARDEISRRLIGGDDNALVYLPTSPQAPGNLLFAGMRGDGAVALRKLDAGLTALDAGAVDEIQRLQVREFVGEEMYSFRVAYWLSAAVGVLALVLTLTGVYGVVAFAVSQRTREIGVRMAMGATPRAVTALVIRQSMRFAVAGAAAGAALALAGSKILAAVLVMIDTFDGIAYAGGVLIVLAACAAAAYLPSRRAARVDPMAALRCD